MVDGGRYRDIAVGVDHSWLVVTRPRVRDFGQTGEVLWDFSRSTTACTRQADSRTANRSSAPSSPRILESRRELVAHFAQHTCGESLFVLGDEAWRPLADLVARARAAPTTALSRSCPRARRSPLDRPSKVRGVSPVPPRAGMFSATVDASTVRRSQRSFDVSQLRMNASLDATGAPRGPATYVAK